MKTRINLGPHDQDVDEIERLMREVYALKLSGRSADDKRAHLAERLRVYEDLSMAVHRAFGRCWDALTPDQRAAHAERVGA